MSEPSYGNFIRGGVDSELKVSGLPELVRRLRAVPEKLRYQALRNALAAGARVIRNKAKMVAPVLKRPTKRRTAGLLRDSIVVRTSKRDKANGDVGVFVGVRKASRKNRGAASPRDPFYWSFQEFGTKHHRAQPFLTPAAQSLPEAQGVIERAIPKAVARIEKGLMP